MNLAGLDDADCRVVLRRGTQEAVYSFPATAGHQTVANSTTAQTGTLCGSYGFDTEIPGVVISGPKPDVLFRERFCLRMDFLYAAPALEGFLGGDDFVVVATCGAEVRSAPGTLTCIRPG
jgi:hypothetical protein